MDAQKICPGRSTEKSPHLYRRNAEIAGFSRNIYEPWMENGEVDQKIHEKYQRVEAGAYLRVCEILENLSMDSRIWSSMRCGQSLYL